jgi:Cof subfamily protein (haloacid dehalogenase superfamily)
MTDYKVLFLDVDGTIIRPDDTIEESTKEAIRQVQSKGIEVFIATGRPLHELGELARELNVHSFIGYNGAYGVYREKELFNDPMDANLVDQFLEIAIKHHHEAILYTTSQNLFTNMAFPMLEVFTEKFHLYKNELYTPEQHDQILGMTLLHIQSSEEMNDYNREGIHLSEVNIPDVPLAYDIIRDSTNKGYGVKMALKHLGFTKEQAIAFGDGMNDKEMLMSVGEGFAMGNGHPELFQYAKHKTTDVSNSGIYNGLKTLGLVE